MKKQLFAQLSLASAMALSASAALTAVSNGSFETFTGSSTTYPYGVVTDGWVYAGTPGTASVLAPLSETLGTAPLTPDGVTWLLVDSRSDPQTITQSLGTIIGGENLTIEALIGSVTNAALADFEIGLYRSLLGSGTADQVLLTLTNSDFTAPALGGTVAASSASYLTAGLDNGEELFIRIRSTDPQAGLNSVEQTLIDSVVVSVPEPSSTALLGLGGLALILRRRK